MKENFLVHEKIIWHGKISNDLSDCFYPSFYKDILKRERVFTENFKAFFEDATAENLKNKFIPIYQTEIMSRKKFNLEKDKILSSIAERVEKNQLLFEKSLEKLNWQEINLVIAANDIYVPALKKKISVKKIIVVVPSFLSFSKEANPKDYQRIVQRMKKNLKDVRIVVLSNLLKKMLRKAAGKKVFFSGQKKQVEKYYVKSQIFLFPSKFEAFGLVLLGAMASGLPVIAFRPSSNIITASKEIISNGLNGFLVRDLDEMAQKIDLLLKNDRLHAKMSKNSLLKARAHTWKAHVTNLLKLQAKA